MVTAVELNLIGRFCQNVVPFASKTTKESVAMHVWGWRDDHGDSEKRLRRKLTHREPVDLSGRGFETMKPDCEASEFQGSRESRPGPGVAYGGYGCSLSAHGGERKILSPERAGLTSVGSDALNRRSH
jgi:hypothetical protein